MSRRATHAGSWYSNDRAELAGELAGWLSEAQVTCGAARAIIAPHAGYSYSGPTAAWAYKHINRIGIRRIFLLGPSHHVYSSRCSLTTCTEYSSPLGPLQVDLQASDTLRSMIKLAVLAAELATHGGPLGARAELWPLGLGPLGPTVQPWSLLRGAAKSAGCSAFGQPGCGRQASSTT